MLGIQYIPAKQHNNKKYPLMIKNPCKFGKKTLWGKKRKENWFINNYFFSKLIKICEVVKIKKFVHFEVFVSYFQNFSFQFATREFGVWFLNT